MIGVDIAAFANVLASSFERRVLIDAENAQTRRRITVEIGTERRSCRVCFKTSGAVVVFHVAKGSEDDAPESPSERRFFGVRIDAENSGGFRTAIVADGAVSYISTLFADEIEVRSQRVGDALVSADRSHERRISHIRINLAVHRLRHLASDVGIGFPRFVERAQHFHDVRAFVERIVCVERVGDVVEVLPEARLVAGMRV